jgi:hypothetical protein
MFKKIAWTLLALALAGVVAGTLLWLRQREAHVPVATFIPDNSAVVIRVTGGAHLPDGWPDSLAGEFACFCQSPLHRLAGDLTRAGVVDSASITVALRVEGKGKVRFLYMLEMPDRGGPFNRGDLSAIVARLRPGDEARAKNFEGRELHLLSSGEGEICHAAAGGMLLLSDSELYVEDALKQISREEPGDPGATRYQQAYQYFSPAAGVNIFLDAACFAELLPLYLPAGTNVAGMFAWGALDAHLSPRGARLDGFMRPGEGGRSLPELLQGQEPAEIHLDEVLPAAVKAVSVLRLSDVGRYLENLEKYRPVTGPGASARREWLELSRGEIARGVLSVSAKGQEEGITVVHLKSGDKAENLLREMVESHARRVNVSPDSLCRPYQVNQKEVTCYAMPVADFCAATWGPFFDGTTARHALVLESYLVLASSPVAVQRFLADYSRRSSLRDVAWYKRAREQLGVKHNWMHLAETASMLPRYRARARGAWGAYLRALGDRLPAVSSWGYQWSAEEGMIYTSLVASVEKMEEAPARVMWQTKLDDDVTLKPAIVKNHVSGERELLVQDRSNNLYLINDNGMILWKLPLPEAINSEVYQVDFYKNGKLQYLFSTPSRLYLIDRNGAYLPRYPLALKSRCEAGITLFDYENDRDYRVAAPGEDRHLYLYGLDGNPVQGWETPRADNPVASKLYHFRIEQKDYLVFADRYRLYMLDRRGNQRARVDHLFDMPGQSPLYLSRRGDKPVVLFADARREAWWVDFNGDFGSWKPADAPRTDDSREPASDSRNPTAAPLHSHLNIGDLNADGSDEWIFTEGPALSIHDHRGKLLQEHRWEGASLGFPYIYRFSARDARVGMLDEANGQLFLVGKAISKGFPVAGTSPFSIAFHEGGGEASPGFYLFAGNAGGYLVKYRVQQ